MKSSRLDQSTGSNKQLGPTQAEPGQAGSRTSASAHGNREISRLLQVVMQSPNPMITLDERGCIVLWNEAIAHMLGHSAKEAIGGKFSALILDRDGESLMESLLSRVFRGEVVSDLEIRLRTRQGHGRVMKSRMYPIMGPGGKVRECAVSGTDGTDLERALAAHEESEERYRALAAASFEGIMIIRDGVLIDANENLARLSGYQLHELRGMVVADVAPSSFKGVQLQEIASSVGKPYEFQLFRKDGAVVPVEVRGKTIRYLGEPATVWSIRDLTEIRRAQEALHENRESIRAIFESVRDCVFVKDMELRFVDVNPAMLKLFDLKPSAIIGKTADAVFGPEADTHIRPVELRVLAGETIEQEYTLLVNGELLTFQDVRAPLRSAEGQIIGLCGISRNITDRKRAIPDVKATAADYPSAAWRSALHQARHAASREGIVLLLGESGSGKDYLARWIHDHSRRGHNPFFSINCAALPQELAESELFGHETGAFTGAKARKRGLLELAEGGTLLLNEIGELPRPLQSKLLTFLDTRSFLRLGGEKGVRVDARVIAATHRRLEEEVAAGRFLEPLFYRLNVFSIIAPPLRERVQDIPILAREILDSIAAELHLSELPRVDADAVKALSAYHWPGNVRELRNVLERALILWNGGPLELALPTRHSDRQAWAYPVEFSSPLNLHELCDSFRNSLCLEAIRRSADSKTEAARLLGISRDSLYRYMRTAQHSKASSTGLDDPSEISDRQKG
jgi:PAS domain S-box-containing protein